MLRAFVLLAILVVAAPAHADEGKLRWYGWQILLADAGALGLGGLVGSGEVMVAGYLASGPTIHLLHRHYGRAALSLGLRAVLPLLLGELERCAPEEEYCGLGGALLGAGLASLTDVVLLGLHRVPMEPAAPRVALGITRLRGGGLVSVELGF
jgi:hypothetical protein